MEKIYKRSLLNLILNHQNTNNFNLVLLMLFSKNMSFYRNLAKDAMPVSINVKTSSIKDYMQLKRQKLRNNKSKRSNKISWWSKLLNTLEFAATKHYILIACNMWASQLCNTTPGKISLSAISQVKSKSEI